MQLTSKDINGYNLSVYKSHNDEWLNIEVRDSENRCYGVDYHTSSGVGTYGDTIPKNGEIRDMINKAVEEHLGPEWRIP
jgi:hypothetical protein